MGLKDVRSTHIILMGRGPARSGWVYTALTLHGGVNVRCSSQWITAHLFRAGHLTEARTEA